VEHYKKIMPKTTGLHPTARLYELYAAVGPVKNKEIQKPQGKRVKMFLQHLTVLRTGDYYCSAPL
jgi:hypothetical protein